MTSQKEPSSTGLTELQLVAISSRYLKRHLWQKLREQETARLKEELSSHPFYATQAMKQPGNTYWERFTTSYHCHTPKVRLLELCIQRGLLDQIEPITPTGDRIPAPSTDTPESRNGSIIENMNATQ